MRILVHGRHRTRVIGFRVVDDAPFDESKHPRKKDGEFAPKGGGESGGSAAPKSKKEVIADLLKNGTTTTEVLAATGWPAVSMPAQAHAAGMKLEKYKEGGVTKYKGTPYTPEEKAAVDKSLKAKKESKLIAALDKVEAAPPPVKVEPAPVTNVTPAEVAKAKSTYPLGTHILPLVGKEDLAEFNAKWSGENAPKTDAQALQKIAAFRALKAKNDTAAAEVAAKAKQQAAAQLAQQQAEAVEAAKKNKEVMSELGINEAEALGFGALVKMLGGNQSDVIASFKTYENQAKSYGYPVTGFQAALIRNYTDGGYGAINSALRTGTWTVAQHVYAKMVNKALRAMPTYTGTVRRGAHLSPEEQAKYVVGNVTEERAFTSTSISKPFGGNTNFVITAIGANGAHVKKLSNHAGEDEVLFAARTFFKVTKVDGAPGGTMTVHMEEMRD